MLSRARSRKTRMVVHLVTLLAVLGAALMSCRATDTETPTSTAMPVPSPSPSATEEPTATVPPAPTSTPKATATSIAKPTSTPAPASTEEPTATVAPAPTPEPTATALPEVDSGERYVHQSLATGDVGTNEYASSLPGKSEVLEREYPGAPALIPHSIAALKLIKDRNDCLMCHEEGMSFGDSHVATKIPDSHFIDLLTGARSETVQGTRYYCLLCHVPQAAGPPLR